MSVMTLSDDGDFTAWGQRWLGWATVDKQTSPFCARFSRSAQQQNSQNSKSIQRHQISWRSMMSTQFWIPCEFPVSWSSLCLRCETNLLRPTLCILHVQRMLQFLNPWPRSFETGVPQLSQASICHTDYAYVLSRDFLSLSQLDRYRLLTKRCQYYLAKDKGKMATNFMCEGMNASFIMSSKTMTSFPHQKPSCRNDFDVRFPV